MLDVLLINGFLEFMSEVHLHPARLRRPPVMTDENSRAVYPNRSDPWQVKAVAPQLQRERTLKFWNVCRDYVDKRDRYPVSVLLADCWRVLKVHGNVDDWNA